MSIFSIVGPIVAALGFTPYIIQTYKGVLKPRIASWTTWSLVTAIATAAEFSNHDYVSAAFTGLATVPELIILAMAFKKRDFDYNWIDAASQLLSLIGIIFWLTSHNPEWAVIATIGADFFGAVPTFYHAWLSPHNEAWLPFLISAIGAGISLLAIRNIGIVAAGFPIYLLLIDISLSLTIFFRQKISKTTIV